MGKEEAEEKALRETHEALIAGKTTGNYKIETQHGWHFPDGWFHLPAPTAVLYCPPGIPCAALGFQVLENKTVQVYFVQGTTYKQRAGSVDMYRPELDDDEYKKEVKKRLNGENQLSFLHAWFLEKIHPLIKVGYNVGLTIDHAVVGMSTFRVEPKHVRPIQSRFYDRDGNLDITKTATRKALGLPPIERGKGGRPLTGHKPKQKEKPKPRLKRKLK